MVMKSKTRTSGREPGAPNSRHGSDLSDRQARQAAALKANLQKRKQQAKARASAVGGASDTKSDA
ncbi:MAG: hypothetical protein ACFB0Z_10510 [Candidatus Phaeomarinobacter sp.]